MDNTLGRVVAVAGSQMTVTLDDKESVAEAVRIDEMVKVRCVDFDVVGTIAAIQLEISGPSPRRIFMVDLLGEIASTSDGRQQFSRGVSHHPVIGTPVRAATEADRTAVYSQPSASNVRIGALYHNPLRPALIRCAPHSSWSTSCYRRTSRCSARPAQENHVPLL